MKKIITITGIVLAISISNISTAVIDSRGGESCSELRNAIKAAKNKLKRFKKYSRTTMWETDKSVLSGVAKWINEDSPEDHITPEDRERVKDWSDNSGLFYDPITHSLNFYKQKCKGGDTYGWHDRNDDNISSVNACLRVERIKLLLQDAKDEIADARDDYSLDGCATGGTINYNRN